MPRRSRWAATGATAAATATSAAVTLLLLCGATPCQAFLAAAGHGVLVPQQQPCRNNRCSSSRRTAAMSAADDLSPQQPAVVVAEVDDPPPGASASSSSSSSSSSSAEGSTDAEKKTAKPDAKDAAADAGRRWINEMKAGDKVIGYVAGTTKFAAFVDCSVVRRAAKDKVVPVTGFLHLADINSPYALEGTPRAKDCEVEVKKGIHLTAYVKDVFPNAGRMTLSLDPNMNKEKVVKLRDSKRQRSRKSRRQRIHKKGQKPAVGDIVEGYVRKVEDSMLLVDVMFAQLSVLRANKIRNSGEGGKFVNLSEKAKPGDVITVSIEAIQTSQRRGVEDDKATINFVGWGEAGTAGESNATEGGGGGLDDAPGQASFDIAAEIDALPVRD
ncbi:unnamed protein product [Pylaiella littoralis]